MSSSLAVSADTPSVATAAPLAAPSIAGSPAQGTVAGVLDDLARMAREVLDAEHAGILIFDDAGRLVPAASAARHDRPARRSRFRAMPPIEPARLSKLRDVFRAGRVVVIEDALSSGVVPGPWCNAFGLTSLAIAPLSTQDGPAGLLIVDHGLRPHVYGEDELTRLAAVARGTAAALCAAQAQVTAGSRSLLAERALMLAALIDEASTLDNAAVATIRGARELLDATSASVMLFEGDELVTLVSSGPGQPEPGRRRLPRYAASLDDLRALWRTDPSATVVLDPVEAELLVPEEGRLPAYVVLPLPDKDGAAGIVLIGRRQAVQVDTDRLAVAKPLAARLRQAMTRFGVEQRLATRVALAETLHRLADEMAVAPNLARALERLTPAVRDAGAEIVDAHLCDPALAALFGAPEPVGPLATLLRSWRRRCVQRPTEVGDLVVVPMVHDDELAGVLRVRPVDRIGDDALLAVAAGFAAVVARIAMRARIADAERDRAIDAERERLGRDLHDTIGQTLFGIGLKLDECAGETGEPATRERLARLRSAVCQANAEVRHAIHALSFVDGGRDGLVPSVRNLVDGLSDVAVTDLRVTGTSATLPPAREEALFRVAHEALQNVRRHSNASLALVELAYDVDRVMLTVCDDGDGISTDVGEHPGLHFGLRTMRRRMEEVGGGLEVRNAVPRGVLVAAWVPTG